MVHTLEIISWGKPSNVLHGHFGHRLVQDEIRGNSQILFHGVVSTSDVAKKLLRNSQASIIYIAAHGWTHQGEAHLKAGHEILSGSDISPSSNVAGLVLDACNTATTHWRQGAPAVGSLPILGGSGIHEPQASHGKYILSALLRQVTAANWQSKPSGAVVRELFADVLKEADRNITATNPRAKLRISYSVS